MPSNTSRSFLDAMAIPARPVTLCQEKIRPDEALLENLMGSLTEMLDTLEEHSDIRNSTSKPAEETTMATCIRDQRVGDTAYIEDIEPVRLRKRLVLRSNVPIPTGALRRLHESYKDAEGFINQILVDDVELTKMSMEISGKYRSGRSEEEYILFRCALREVYQGKLHAQAQLDGVTVPEIRNLQLLEEFHHEQGCPNKSEVLLLSQITRNSPLYIEGWFAAKENSLKAFNALFRKMVSSVTKNAGHELAVLHAMYLMEQDEKKPLFRH